MPASVFVQAGAADHVDTVSLGAIWPLPWQRDVSFGRLATSIEASLGQWQTHGQRHDTRPFAQFGFTPSLRFYPDALGGNWFGEAGIGANVIAPAYHTDGKRFSTAFNFGDHVAIGREFGTGHRQETRSASSTSRMPASITRTPAIVRSCAGSCGLTARRGARDRRGSSTLAWACLKRASGRTMPIGRLRAHRDAFPEPHRTSP